MAHKLLLADDSVTIQRVIELTFANEDVHVLTAGDGDQAIARIQAERPDIVLADIGMPRRSGYDVAAFVKGDPSLSHVPVLLLTGAFEPVDEGRAQAAGCDGVLVKPFEPQQVIARVRELLQGPARRPSANVTRAVSDVPRPVERFTQPWPGTLSSSREPVAPPATPQAPAAPAGGPQAHGTTARGLDERSLDDYFERLDAAFANMAGSGSRPASAGQPETNRRDDGPVMEQDLDWFDDPGTGRPEQAAESPSTPRMSGATDQARGAKPRVPDPPAEVIDLPPTSPAEPVPATYASPPITPGWPLPQLPSIEPPDAPPEMASQPEGPARGRQTHTMNAHSAIAEAFSALLAVEQGEASTAPVRLVAPERPAAVTDELVAEVTRRVIEQLGTAAVREMVADVVSEVSERLVRQEIARIRSGNRNQDSGDRAVSGDRGQG